MNVYVKILTKLLSIRLKEVHPSMIHAIQTAAYGKQDFSANLLQTWVYKVSGSHINFSQNM